MRFVVAALILAVTPAFAETSLTLESMGDDWVGGGRAQHFTEADGTFHVTPNYRGGVSMEFCPRTSRDCWKVELSAPFDRPLEAGFYPVARRYVANERGSAGLAVTGEGRGCSHSTGWFQVKELRRGSGGVIESFRVVFEQSCDVDAGTLVGEARWEVDVPVTVHPTASVEGRRREPIWAYIQASARDGSIPRLSASSLPRGAVFEDRGDGSAELVWFPRLDQLGRWAVLVRATAESGESDEAIVPLRVVGTTRLVVDSDLSDPVGLGHDETRIHADGFFGTDRSIDESLTVSFGETPTTYPAWIFWFAAPLGAPIRVGTYPDAAGFDGPHDRPRLSIVADGRRCRELAFGRFDVAELAYGEWGNIDRFRASFEQQCEGAAGGLRGEILYGADVIENTSPVASVGAAHLTAECTSPTGARLRLDGSRSWDPDGDPLDFTWSAEGVVMDDPASPSPSATFPTGTTITTLTVTDGRAWSTDTVVVTVVDTTPPAVTVSADPLVLWPPDGRMREIRTSVRVTDVCDPTPSFILTSVGIGEPFDGREKPADAEDAVPGTPDLGFRLRARRDGTSDGRVYTIVYEGRDRSGNAATATTKLQVPHDRGN